MLDALMRHFLPPRPARPSQEAVKAAKERIDQMTPAEALRVLTEEIKREPSKH